MYLIILCHAFGYYDVLYKDRQYYSSSYDHFVTERNGSDWIHGRYATVDELDEECKWVFGNEWQVRCIT